VIADPFAALKLVHAQREATDPSRWETCLGNAAAYGADRNFTADWISASGNPRIDTGSSKKQIPTRRAKPRIDRSGLDGVASIIIADKTPHYDGTYLENHPLGGTESLVIQLARELARLNHEVRAYTNCDGPIEHEGVRWKPVSEAPPVSCDLYIAVQLLNYSARRLQEGKTETRPRPVWCCAHDAPCMCFPLMHPEGLLLDSKSHARPVAVCEFDARGFQCSS
jgi:hypothetical protein